MIPHVTDAIQDWITDVARKNVDGSGASPQVPLVGATNEQKTKPCQHSVKLLREAGLKPDILMCRSEQPVDAATRRKLSLFCQVPPECVVSLHDVSNLYRVPLLLAEQDVGRLICEQLGYPRACAESSCCAEVVAATLP